MKETKEIKTSNDSEPSDRFKEFVDRSKKSQQDRDKKKISQLQQKNEYYQQQYKIIEKEYETVKDNLQQENKDLKLLNIKLDSENKALRMKCAMFENIIKDTMSNNNSQPDQTAYRILQRENTELKKLIKSIISPSSAGDSQIGGYLKQK